MPWDPLLTPKEVAEMLGIRTPTVRRLVRAGHLPCVRVGRLIRIRASEFDQFTRIEEARRRRAATANEASGRRSRK